MSAPDHVDITDAARYAALAKLQDAVETAAEAAVGDGLHVGLVAVFIASIGGRQFYLRERDENLDAFLEAVRFGALNKAIWGDDEERGATPAGTVVQ